MFFNISSTPDLNFPNSYPLSTGFLNCDNGWQQRGTSFVKGYADLGILENNATGNFCIIEDSGNSVQILHNKNRSFPLRYSADSVTNLYTGNKYKSVWADQSLKVNSIGTVELTPMPVDFKIPQGTLTTGQAVDNIRSILTTNIENFYQHTSDHMNIFCSGGLDTLLLYSMLDYTNKPFTLLDYELVELDLFVMRNTDWLTDYWAYTQIHHWKDPTYFVTGSCGDEYFLRGPATVSLLCAWHGIDLEKLLYNSPDSYHTPYFFKEKNISIFQKDWDKRHYIKARFPTVELLHNHVIDMLVNDHQHWHLGNTITWTPFKNIEIVKVLLQLDINDLIPQFLNATITKSLINPDLLPTLSKYKNIHRRENLNKLFEFDSNKIV